MVFLCGLCRGERLGISSGLPCAVLAATITPETSGRSSGRHHQELFLFDIDAPRVFRAVRLSCDQVKVSGLCLFLRFFLFDIDAPRVCRALRLSLDRVKVNGLWLFLLFFV